MTKSLMKRSYKGEPARRYAGAAFARHAASTAEGEAAAGKVAARAPASAGERAEEVRPWRAAAEREMTKRSGGKDDRAEEDEARWCGRVVCVGCGYGYQLLLLTKGARRRYAEGVERACRYGRYGGHDARAAHKKMTKKLKR